MSRTIIIGGGTFSHVRAHLSLAAPAFGSTAKLMHLFMPGSELVLTKMADSTSDITTNDDLAKYVERLITDETVKTIVFNAAVCDFTGKIGNVASGKYAERLSTAEGNNTIDISPSDKIISSIRVNRPDIFLVGFKTTAGAKSFDNQFLPALRMMKKSKCNLVLANDVVTHRQFIITPEEASYDVGPDRIRAISELVSMIGLRNNLTYHRTNFKQRSSFDMYHTPDTFQAVMSFLIENGGYIENNGNGFTPGHFCYKFSHNTFLTSQRKANHNLVFSEGLTFVEVKDGKVSACGDRKPSVGATSQHLMFERYPGYDCIVHTHNPRRPDSKVPVVSQRPFQCGSIECGLNTLGGMKEFDGIMAVYNDKHGINVLFRSSDDPKKVIEFIKSNVVLGEKVK